MSSTKKKVVLAFSGGLDTTYCALYLREELGYEIHTAIVDTGGFSKEELAETEQRAKDLGVASHTTLDEVHHYYEACLRYLLAGNVLKNNAYPLSVSAERVFQATAIAHYAKKVEADAVAHGSTGAGNDQVRFDMVFHILCPEAEIITPIRDMQLSREAEINYLKEKGVVRDWSKAAYSINKGLWGTSVGGRETLGSWETLPDSAFPTQPTKTTPEELLIDFEAGEPVGVNGKKYTHPVATIQAIQEIAGAFAIGRGIHVGDTIIGIKGRVGFEAAAPLILIEAHRVLEKHTLTKHQLILKDQVAASYGNLVHEGQFLEPLARDIEAFLTSTQKHVTGQVRVGLQPYRFDVIGIKSPYDLMSSKFGAYGEMNLGWSGDDVKGFSKIFGNQTAIYHQVKNDVEK